MNERLEKIEQDMIVIQEEIKKLQVLIRVNNLLMSRFILQLASTRKSLGIPKRETFFKFELLEEDYQDLVNEFDKHSVDKALFYLDRLLLQNKQNCPHNIKKYIRDRLRKNKNE